MSNEKARNLTNTEQYYSGSSIITVPGLAPHRLEVSNVLACSITYLTRPLSTLSPCITAPIKQNIHHGCCTQSPPECTFIVTSQVEAVTISSTATKCFEIRGYLHRLATWASLGFRSAISAFSPSSVLKSVSVSVSIPSSRPSGSSTMARP